VDFIFFLESTLEKLLKSKFFGHPLILYSILKFTEKGGKLFENGISFWKNSLILKILLREKESFFIELSEKTINFQESLFLLIQSSRWESFFKFISSQKAF
jgi:hypothetical protein